MTANVLCRSPPPTSGDREGGDSLQYSPQGAEMEYGDALPCLSCSGPLQRLCSPSPGPSAAPQSPAATPWHLSSDAAELGTAATIVLDCLPRTDVLPARPEPPPHFPDPPPPDGESRPAHPPGPTLI